VQIDEVGPQCYGLLQCICGRIELYVVGTVCPLAR